MKTQKQESEARGPDPLPLNKSKGITTAFYIREDNLKLLEDVQVKQNRSLSWLVNNAIEKFYGEQD